MYFLLEIEGTKIVEIQVLQDVEGLELAENQKTIEISDDVIANKVLNNYDRVTVKPIAGGGISLDLGDAEEEPRVRMIQPSDWIRKVRPALMRAATTTHLFNA